MKNLSKQKISNFMSKSFHQIGLNEVDIKFVVNGLVSASLRGVDSHGIRLFKHYLISGMKGRKNIKPSYKFYKKYKTSLLLDADNAYGLASCGRALNKSLSIVNKFGFASVGVINSSHCGCLASSVIPIVKKGYMVLGFTHADSLLLSYGSKESFFGTNPLCFGFPRKKKEPFCLDMSPSIFSWNKVRSYKINNKRLPPNVCADKFGNMTTDPQKATSLIPIGNYKGYGLSSMIEILCSVMTGMSYGKKIPPMFTFDMKKPRKLGQFFMVFKTDLFISDSQIYKSLENMYKDVYKQRTKKINNKIFLPNDPETLTLKERLKKGIPITKEIINDFEDVSKELNIKSPF